MLSLLKLSKDKGYYRANLVSASAAEEFRSIDVSFYEDSVYELLLTVKEKEGRFFIYDDWIVLVSSYFEKFLDSGRDVTMTLHHEDNKRLLCVSVADFGSLWFEAREEQDGLVVKYKTNLASRPLLEAFDITNE